MFRLVRSVGPGRGFSGAMMHEDSGDPRRCSASPCSGPSVAYFRAFFKLFFSEFWGMYHVAGDNELIPRW